MNKGQLASLIAQRVGIPDSMIYHGSGGPWMSTEGTVSPEWLTLVGESLDVAYRANKVSTMRALVERVGETWDETRMSSTQTVSRGGGNIRKEAFEAVLRGLAKRPEPQVAEWLESGFTPELAPERANDPMRTAPIRIRAAQRWFRAALLAAYGERCAVSAFDTPAVLEAAHVVPWAADGDYDVTNGLLLRAHIHTLFDRGLLAFDLRRKVILKPHLRGGSYGNLEGRFLAEPRTTKWRVSDEKLQAHREKSGFD